MVKQKDDWHKKWDNIYYNFINHHKTYLKKNYATSRMVVHWEKKSEKEKLEIKSSAKKADKRTYIVGIFRFLFLHFLLSSAEKEM